MKLSPEQESLVRAWAAQGDSLSEIQTKLAWECDVHLNYLDTRFLLLDLNIELAERNPPKKDSPPPPPATGPRAMPTPEETALPGEDDGLPAEPSAMQDDPYAPPDAPYAPASPFGCEDPLPSAANVSVEVSRIQRPGFALSGSVVWTDGTKGEWAITNDGRIALDHPENKTYRPCREDVQDFEEKLRATLSGAGMY